MMVKHSHDGLNTEDEIRLSALFERLDINGDGRINVKDLTEALQHLQIPKSMISGHAKHIIDQHDTNNDGELDFADFVRYVVEHEKKLRLSFAVVDHNKDGYIDKEEIMTTFEKLGVHIDTHEAERLLKRMDKDETLLINWEEWRDHLLFHPYGDILDIVHYWRHSTIIDVGEDALVPDDFTETELQTGMWWRHLAAGAAAGAVSRTCTAPLDRLKVLLQVYGSKHKSLGIASGFQHMLQEGGCKSLWRGNGINVIKIAPESAIKFMAYEKIKRLIKGDSVRELGAGERFISGSLAGAISQSTIYPMEVIKTRLALRKTGQYSGIADCAGKLIKTEGITCLYRGYVPNLLGIIPYAGIDLAIYETLKRFYIKRHSHGEDPGILVLLACGTCSSTCGQLASYPLALVRTKLQAQAQYGPKDNMVTIFRWIWQNEGPRGLYRGLTPNFMKVIPAVSISYVVYENVRKFLGVEMT